MGAIAGIIHFDGTPVEPQDLQRISQALQPFGRDGERIIRGDGYGLVVRLSYITPEDRLDSQPIRVFGGDILIFEGRLDNRIELLRALSIKPNEAVFLGDSALAGKAWERWGIEAIEKLIGYFTMAYWRTTSRVLTLVRSAPRGNLIYVHRRADRLYFSSMPQGLFALTYIPRELDQEALTEILLGLTSEGRTLFANIHQVRNSHFAEYHIGGGCTRQYWFPDDSRRKVNFHREEEAWEVLKTTFESVVRAQLRSVKPVGIMMSGGLDSCAIAGQAALIQAESGMILPSYTRIPAPDYPMESAGLRYDDERPRVEAMAAMYGNLKTHYLHAGHEPVIKALLDSFPVTYNVSGTSPTHLTGNEVLIRQAAADGLGVLLHGTLGNTSISFDGRARVRNLLTNGRWITLCQELRAYQRFNHGLGLSVMRTELLGSILPQRIHKKLRKLLKGNNHSHDHILSRDLANRYDIEGKLNKKTNILYSWRWLDSRERRAIIFNKTLHGLGLGGPLIEIARHGLDIRDPCGDRRIVEFCMALPENYFFQDGVPRRLTRLGLGHLIPKTISMDPSMGSQDVDWSMRLLRDSSSVTKSLDSLRNYRNIEMLVKAEVLESALTSLTNDTSSDFSEKYYLAYLCIGLFYMWFESNIAKSGSTDIN